MRLTVKHNKQGCRATSWLTILLLGCLSVVSQSLWAIGLGDIDYTTALGERLDARINVIAPGDVTPENLIVRQLNEQQAAALGVQLVDSFYSFRFQAIAASDGVIHVAVTSDEAITEPYVNILVELRWPQGQVLREYTLLLDLPSVAEPAQQQSSVSAVAAPARSIRSASPSTSRSATQPDSGDKYRVVPGDTLSAIAGRLSASINHSANDLMQWLLENNPQAFVGNDPNRIKAGSLIALPGGVSLSALDSPSRSGKATAVKAVAAPSGDSAIPEPAPTAVQKPMLRITAPESGGAADVDSEQSLGVQLAATREVVDKLRRENRELMARLQRIEQSDFQESLQKLVELKDEQIFELKRQVRILKDENAAAGSGQVKAIGLSGQPPGGLEPLNEKGGAEAVNYSAYLAIGLVVLVVIGVVVVMRSRAHVEPVSVLTEPEPADIDEKAILEELSQVSSPSPHRPSPAEKGPTFRGVTGARRVARLHNNWRPDEDVQRDIQEKMRHYQSPTGSYAAKEDVHGSPVDARITEALALATEGKFDLAEAILISEQVESGEDQRLEDALHYVEKMREKRR